MAKQGGSAVDCLVRGTSPQCVTGDTVQPLSAVAHASSVNFCWGPGIIGELLAVHVNQQGCCGSECWSSGMSAGFLGSLALPCRCQLEHCLAGAGVCACVCCWLAENVEFSLMPAPIDFDEQVCLLALAQVRHGDPLITASTISVTLPLAVPCCLFA
jgi:hypothetical protein